LYIREIAVHDAEPFLRFFEQLDRETTLLLFEPGERPLDVEKQRERIRKILASENERIWVLTNDVRIAGYLGLRAGKWQRNRRTATLAIGILREFQGMGFGSRMMDLAEEWARKKGIHRLELTVMRHNKTAIHLYRKKGFDVEGVRREALYVEGRYVDELYMGKLLNSWFMPDESAKPSNI
jgi:RimJ/RimL family protein N-acetyltransferase